MTFAPWTGPGKNPMLYNEADLGQIKDIFRGLGGNTSPFEAGADSLARQRQMQDRRQTQGPERMLGGGGLRDMFSQGIFGNPQRPTLQNRGPQNLQGQLQRQLGGLRNQMRQQFEQTQGPETTGYSPFPPQGGYNRGINPGGMYTGGRGGGFGSPFGGNMRGGRQQPPAYGGGFELGGGGFDYRRGGRPQPMPRPQPQYGGGFGGGFGGGMMPPPYGGGFGGGFGMPQPQMPNMGYGNRFPGMQFSGPFAQPMMPQNYGMGSFGGFGGRFPMPQPRYPMPQPRMPYPQFPMMGGGFGGGYGGTYGDGTIIG